MDDFSKAITEAFRAYIFALVQEAVTNATRNLVGRVDRLENEKPDSPDLSFEIEDAVTTYLGGLDFSDYIEIDPSEVAAEIDADDIAAEIDFDEVVRSNLKEIIRNI